MGLGLGLGLGLWLWLALQSRRSTWAHRSGTCHVPQSPHFTSAFERFLFFSASWAFRSSRESGNGPAGGFSAGGVWLQRFGVNGQILPKVAEVRELYEARYTGQFR